MLALTLATVTQRFPFAYEHVVANLIHQSFSCRPLSHLIRDSCTRLLVYRSRGHMLYHSALDLLAGLMASLNLICPANLHRGQPGS